jgi:hypothetical protein
MQYVKRLFNPNGIVTLIVVFILLKPLGLEDGMFLYLVGTLAAVLLGIMFSMGNISIKGIAIKIASLAAALLVESIVLSMADRRIAESLTFFTIWVPYVIVIICLLFTKPQEADTDEVVTE